MPLTLTAGTAVLSFEDSLTHTSSYVEVGELDTAETTPIEYSSDWCAVARFQDTSEFPEFPREELALELADLPIVQKYGMADVLDMLAGHWSLVRGRSEISECLQAMRAGAAPQLTRTADIILRYHEFEKSGADAASWQELLRALRAGFVLDDAKVYAVEGRHTVHQAMVRKLDDRVLDKLTGHKLMTLIQESLYEDADGGVSILDRDPGGVLVDMAEDDAIGGVVMAALSDLGVRYNEDVGGFFQEDDEFNVAENLDSIMSALVARLDARALSDVTKRAVYEKYLIRLALLVFAGRGKSESGDVDVVGSLCVRIKEALATLGKRGDVTVKGEIFAKFYDDVHDLFRNHILDNALNPWLDGLKSVALRAFGQSVDARDVDFQVGIQNARTWKSFAAAIERTLNECKASSVKQHLVRTFGSFIKRGDEFSVKLESFGKYFREQTAGEPITLRFIPVKGLAATLAIDAGSDCGKGQATGRALDGRVTVYLITDEAAQRVWGYAEFNEARAGGKPVLMVDAFNPSTELELHGDSFLQAMRRQCRDMMAAAGGVLAGVIVSSTPDLVSNRHAISQAVARMKLPKVEDVFGPADDEIPEVWEYADPLAVKRQSELRDKIAALNLEKESLRREIAFLYSNLNILRPLKSDIRYQEKFRFLKTQDLSQSRYRGIWRSVRSEILQVWIEFSVWDADALADEFAGWFERVRDQIHVVERLQAKLDGMPRPVARGPEQKCHDVLIELCGQLAQDLSKLLSRLEELSNHRFYAIGSELYDLEEALRSTVREVEQPMRQVTAANALVFIL